MTAPGQREAIWDTIERHWDVLVIGGGITGAAILREATRAGLRVLLVEQKDFAWGTSSRSTKLVHGGFRYLTQGRVGLVREAARHRKQLLAQGRGLITPVGFLFASYRGDRLAPWLYEMALAIYDGLAAQWDHERYDPGRFRLLAPHLRSEGLIAGLRGLEATTDDARLVFRLIQEAVMGGASALNYATVTGLLKDDNGVTGVIVRDETTGHIAEVRARAVINATGAWVDRLRAEVGSNPCIRPLRGSHLLFPAWRFPLAQTIAFEHPLDGRYVCVVPWEGATLVGTTDLDHRESLDQEATISPEEVAYLMAAVEGTFPALGLTLDDIVATYSGVRPVVDTGKSDPSKESRDHIVMDEQGLITVTGGKLTTFRKLALDTLEAIRPRLHYFSLPDRHQSLFEVDVEWRNQSLSEETRERLGGRYGSQAPRLVEAAQPGELELIRGTPYLWAELRWAARSEWVQHLDDLLLRRIRLALMLPEGGAEHLPRIRAVCQAELEWSDARWENEEKAYLALCARHYSLPSRETIPDWRRLLAEAQARPKPRSSRRFLKRLITGLAALAASFTIGAGALLLRRRHHSGSQPV